MRISRASCGRSTRWAQPGAPTTSSTLQATTQVGGQLLPLFRSGRAWPLRTRASIVCQLAHNGDCLQAAVPSGAIKPTHPRAAGCIPRTLPSALQ